MDSAITQDDVIYFVVTDRFFGANKRSADPADNLIHGGTLDPGRSSAQTARLPHRARHHRDIYDWTRALIRLRKQNAALKYGTTITLWSDDFVYAFLRIATDDVALVVINNGYLEMPRRSA